MRYCYFLNGKKSAESFATLVDVDHALAQAGVIARASVGEKLDLYIHDSQPDQVWSWSEAKYVGRNLSITPMDGVPDMLRIPFVQDGVDYAFRSTYRGDIVELYDAEGQLLADAEFDHGVEQCFVNLCGEQEGAGGCLPFFEYKGRPAETAAALVNFLDA